MRVKPCYGANSLCRNPLPLIPQQSLFAPGAGLTLWRRPAAALLIKHSPWGGEHDHYDRLGLMLWHRNGWLLTDMGTTGYGAKMHYDYYKNSATHNTLCVNQSNQPPANPQVLGWHMDDDSLWLDSEVDWGKPRRSSTAIAASSGTLRLARRALPPSPAVA